MMIDLCIPTNETVQVDQPWVHAAPRYQLCQVPSNMRQLHGFPISQVDSQEASPPFPPHRNGNNTSPISSCRDDDTEDDENDDVSVFHLGYYSSQGSITSSSSSSAGVHANVETVVIILHGSLRDADDYFCTGLSMLEKKNDSSSLSSSSPFYDESVLIIAPWFASVSDGRDGTGGETLERLLVWDNAVDAYDSFYWHLWRYGADAKNAPISSYTALDRMIEHLILATDHFPRLQQITVVGHSAGGQMAHRWALLSSSPAWDVSNIRVVAANPRSYAYLDERRWYSSDSTSTKDFRRPLQEELDACPEYDHWLWGLQDGGDLPCKYRDDAIAETRSKESLAQRYTARDVHYLSGQYDIIPQDHDHCAALLQGRTRNERARNYFSGLQEYFGYPVHKLHFVPFSGHDHALMFQSPIGRFLIVGNGTNDGAAHLEDVEDDVRSFSQTSRFIVPLSENP